MQANLASPTWHIINRFRILSVGVSSPLRMTQGEGLQPVCYKCYILHSFITRSVENSTLLSENLIKFDYYFKKYILAKEKKCSIM